MAARGELHCEVIEGLPRDVRAIEDWARLLGRCTKGIGGPDSTCSFAWASALARSHLVDRPITCHVIRDEHELRCILPIYSETRRSRGLPFRSENLITEAHCGRADLLAADADALRAALDALIAARSWDLLNLRVVEESWCHREIRAYALERGLRIAVRALERSPYIDVSPGWDALFAALPKKMRWTIRKSEKDLTALGPLEYRALRAPAEVEELLQSIRIVEEGSWKAASGTSIASQPKQVRFYEELTTLAAESGMLSGHVLRLDGRPIAFVLGIEGDGGVFLDLKESFDGRFAEQSPGHVLKRFAMPSLIERGIRIYDFMGRCDAYKMRWTDRCYGVVSLALFNRTWRGSIAAFGARARETSAAAPLHEVNG